MQKDFLEVTLDIEPNNDEYNLENTLLLYFLLKNKPAATSLPKTDNLDNEFAVQIVSAFLSHFKIEPKTHYFIIKNKLVNEITPFGASSARHGCHKQIAGHCLKKFKDLSKKENLTRHDMKDTIVLMHFKTAMLFAINEQVAARSEFNKLYPEKKHKRSTSLEVKSEISQNENLDAVTAKRKALKLIRNELIALLNEKAEAVNKSSITKKKSEVKYQAILDLANDLKIPTNDFIETIDKHLIADEIRIISTLNENRARCSWFWQESTKTKSMILEYYQKYRECQQSDFKNFLKL